MPDTIEDKLHSNRASDSSRDKEIAAKALEILNHEASTELLRAASSQRLSALYPDRSSVSSQNKSYLQTGINAGTSIIFSNGETKDTVNHLAADLVKTASLFTGGRAGLVTTFLAYGLDQARPADSWKAQAADFVLGGTKGETMKRMFSVIGASDVYAPVKGALMGLGSGAAEELFKRETFTNPSTLNERLQKNAFNGQALLMNAAVFTAGQGLFSGINYAYAGQLAENRMLSGMVMGGSFGFVNGTVGEASREMQETGRVDLSKVFWHGAMDAGVSAAGAGIGMKASDSVFQQKIKDSTINVLDSVGLSPYRRSREFIVTAGEGQLDNFGAAKTSTALTTVREVRNILGWERVGPEKHLLIQHSSENASSIPIPKLADLLASCNPEKLGKAERAASLFPDGKGAVYLERGNESRIRLTLGEQAPHWKNSNGSNRIMLGGRETTFNAMAPLLVGDPHNLDSDYSKKEQEDFRQQLIRGKQIGLDGISNDNWWSLLEPKPGQFDFSYPERISNLIIGTGLKWAPILAFHECGGNVGDTVNQPLPFWVWNNISSQIQGSSPDVGKYKSEQGNVSSEYIQLWADKYAVPLYKNLMTNFRDHFAGKASRISEVNISGGPAGEFRYPSYNQHDKNVQYPTRGALQSYSDLAKADFMNWVMKKYGSFEKVNEAWGGHVENIEPPVDADAFFKDEVHTRTQYGHDFFDWYEGSLVNHVHTVMGAALDVFGTHPAYQKTDIGMKIPGIHWRIGVNAGDHIEMSDRLAELDAGLLTTSNNNLGSDSEGHGYRPLLSGIKEIMSKPGGDRLVVHFTAAEMPDGIDSNMSAHAMPYTLAKWFGQEAAHQGITTKVENALGPNLHNPFNVRLIRSQLKLPGQPGGYSGFTGLRLSDMLSSSGVGEIEAMIQAAKGQQPTSQKNAS